MKSQGLVLVVVFSLLACSANLMAKERRGAEVVITKTDGRQIKGELIAVKPSSLLLLDSQIGADVSVEIGELSVIKIKKKSRALILGAIGLGVGVVLGAAMGGSAQSTEEMGSVTGAVVYGSLFAIPGVLIGALVGMDKTIQLEGKSQEEIKTALGKLRALARITDFQ